MRVDWGLSAASQVERELKKAFARKGIALKLEHRSESVKSENGEILLTLSHGGQTEILRGSHLLLATGRTPRIDSLALDAAGDRDQCPSFG